MNKKILMASALLLLPVVSMAYGADNPQANSPTMPAPDKVKSDADVTLAVKNTIASDKDLAPFGSSVDVNTVNGVVTLSGTVDNVKQKMDLESKAGTVPGVVKIINNLEVKAAPSETKY